MTIHTESDRLLIIDFGSQYTQLIARRIREMGVYCEVWGCEVEPEKIAFFNPKGIILSGGPASVPDLGSPRAPQIIFDLDIPLLGICYGMHTIAIQLGGAVAASSTREFGHAAVELLSESPLWPLRGSGESLDVWMSHGDHVTALPNNFIVTGRTGNCPVAAIADEARKIYGIQFHPEVTHTQGGMEILRQFAQVICQCSTSWKSAAIVEETVQQLREVVGKEQVILGLSGGVDSAVAALLLHQAIGKQLICVFIDTGLLRKDEAKEVKQSFAGFGLNLIAIDAGDRFFKVLEGVCDPEEKRKKIGHLFVKLFYEEALNHKGVSWLAQGTIYSDVIESAALGTGKASVIKSHHNVGGLPKDMHFKLVEPLRKLFKDEVRAIGLLLGLDKQLLSRHPFPGPGLGVRILGEVKKEYSLLLQQADAIFIEELRTAEWYDKLSQAFAVFLPIRSVGVMGDERRYEWVIALRAVCTIDFMTAEWAQLPYSLLKTISHRIVNEVKGISRVVYDISGKPPATIEWE